MSVVLARRIVSEGLVPQEHVNAALLTHVTERAAFLGALVRLHPKLITRLEHELGCTKRQDPIQVDAVSMRLLPQGLCAALLAVPVGRTLTGLVHIVAADAHDPHLASEFAHHLGEPVEVTAAPLGAVIAALTSPVEGDDEPRHAAVPGRPPSVGASEPPIPLVSSGSRPQSVGVSGPPIPLVSSGSRPPSVGASEPPIPLIRVSSEAASAPATVKGVAPQASGVAHASRVVVPARVTPVPQEPIIELTRPKGASVIARREELEAESEEAEGAEPTLESGRRETATSEVDSTRFDEAATADEVVRALVSSLARVASHVVVLAARGKVYEGRDTNVSARLTEVRALVIAADRPSVLVTAIQTGCYVGPMPRTPIHERLSLVLGDPRDEIVVGVVTVSGRAALLYVIAGFETVYVATRAAEKLTTHAARALERVVRRRKQ